MPGKAYYAKNKAKCKAASLRWRRKHPETHLAYLKNWRKKNVSKLRAYGANYRKQRSGRVRNGKTTAADERAWAHTVLVRVNRRAKHQLSVEFITDLWKSQKGRCALSKLKLKRWAGAHDPLCASLDRVDHGKGYIVGNVRFLAWCVNSFRGRMTDDQMMKVARALARS